ncbi:DUF1214 domain-containing protein [Parahaliea aestuarii]|uniref:DUF1214 domain-containing protein n=1 Tax=Parahaliea aestuarii TaxID=1852021 RepID=A0A5C9A4N9_9GAMM|nr:DUF1214 domain-containing protein [Parahaliea aestuarii]TXS94984.1 DUF1214 domain-containing protein [Parahaliea aestuarii]
MAETTPEAKLLSGELWNEFCDALKTAGQQVLAEGVPGDALTRAEGYRYLTRLLRLSLEKQIEFSDAQHPQFYSLSHETAKIGNDNPDNFYQNCAVDGRFEYRIRGNRGSVDYLSIETKAGSFAGQGDMAPTGHIELEELDVDADGNFELMVSAREYSGNWLPMTEASDNLLVRQTFRDRARERRAELSIECLNPARDAVLQPAEFAQQLQAVVPFVSGTAGLFHQWMQVFSAHINQLPPNEQSMCLRAGGDPSIYYHNSYWQLASDEALVVEFTPPRQCRTWNLQLSNYWMESLDYRYHRVCVNKHSAVPEADGSVRIVIAGKNPGQNYPNWLDTAGHSNGAMLLRYVEAQDKPPISTRVVKLAALAG